MTRVLLPPLAAALLAVLLAPARAQTSGPADYVSVTSIDVRPGAFREFEEYVKQVHAAGLQAGVKVRVDAYQVVQGGSPFHYDMISQFATLADLAAAPTTTPIVNTVFGEVEGGRILQSGRAAIEHMETIVLQYRSEYSIEPRRVFGSPLIEMRERELEPARADEYFNLVRSAVAASKAGPVPIIRYTMLYGPAFTVLDARPLDSWKEREQSPPPDPASKLVGGAVKGGRTFVIGYRRDLSRIP
jgi:hypothetical protein